MHAPPLARVLQLETGIEEEEEEEDRFSLDSDCQWLQLQDDTAQQDALDKEERLEAAELQVCHVRLVVSCLPFLACCLVQVCVLPC